MFHLHPCRYIYRHIYAIDIHIDIGLCTFYVYINVDICIDIYTMYRYIYDIDMYISISVHARFTYTSM